MAAGMTPEELAKFLSANDWKWCPDSAYWRKGAHALCEEALRELLDLHHWLVPFFRQAIARGAVGLTVTMEEDENKRGLGLRATWEFPE